MQCVQFVLKLFQILWTILYEQMDQTNYCLLHTINKPVYKIINCSCLSLVTLLLFANYIIFISMQKNCNHLGFEFDMTLQYFPWVNCLYWWISTYFSWPEIISVKNPYEVFIEYSKPNIHPNFDEVYLCQVSLMIYSDVYFDSVVFLFVNREIPCSNRLVVVQHKQIIPFSLST